MVDAAGGAGAVADDPRQRLARAPMTGRQLVAIAMCVLLNALDGFDVLSISFASPGISKEWGIDRPALGVVLSMELIGMMVGSVLLGQLADRVGRRFTVMACLVIMAAGMVATTQVGSIEALAATRLFTGLGIGGMLAVINALAAEFANERSRGAAVAIMAAGYPVGGIAGGAIASGLLAQGDWRDVFWLGAGLTALFLPLVPLFVPEPVSALLQRRGPGTLEQVNRSLVALGHAPTDRLPPVDPVARKSSIPELFRGGMAVTTVLLTIIYFSQLLTFYFVLKWSPKIVADMGFAASSAGSVLVWGNVGGLAGSLLYSALSVRVPTRVLLSGFMIASCAAVALFGHSPADLTLLALAAATAQFCANGVIVGLYGLVASSFPTANRAGGTGFVIGLGRGGAAISPVLGGYLFKAGFSLPVVAGLMATGSLVALAALLMLPRRAAESC
ncbi:MFS transporter [Novosphingobium sp.]|uniref:MFS transporter n=1 Tax=Novosphingobium sp. TaxID=1874826 RepID=UPI00260D1454|nr:MFS transporter [Novosphingobium sp.]